jgi:tRNA(Phe) wybutosine-synthesizing methylase Tyw3
MNLARGSAGIKRCSVISIRGKDLGYIVSVSDTKRMESILYVETELLMGGKQWTETVRIANRKLKESRAKLERFRLALESSPVFVAE